MPGGGPQPRPRRGRLPGTRSGATIVGHADIGQFWRTPALVGAFTDARYRRRLEQLVSSVPGREQRMASLVLKMSVSLDGYVAPLDGSTDWVAAGGSADGLSWTVETVSNAGPPVIG